MKRLFLLPLVLAVVSCGSEGNENPAFFAYYSCAANKIDRSYSEREIVDEPSARKAIEAALSSCGENRDQAFEAFLAEAKEQPEIQEYARANNMDEAQMRKSAETEFERAIRGQLMSNIAELRSEKL
ncbi:hypothetical protein [Sphingopyxis sp.]|uniref:hypothetical protein n=1 Tax=Sphingopyxis sp. TaxID=1908224 RepID=UPI002E07F643|nr:hypothetical protein [Sphingopyxis sp.]